jgi:glycosyltransferase involved in cell wall biosynthesis
MRLSVAGTAWHASEAEILDDPRVEFLGPLRQDDLARAYAQAACVIVPNIELANREIEGFGLVACEAAACGGLVLAARTGGLVSAVLEGETGMLVDSGDAPAWRDAILAIASWGRSQRRAFLERAQASAASFYSWHRVANETLDAYGVGHRAQRTLAVSQGLP